MVGKLTVVDAGGDHAARRCLAWSETEEGVNREQEAATCWAEFFFGYDVAFIGLSLKLGLHKRSCKRPWAV